MMHADHGTNEDGLTFRAWLIRANTAVHEETDYHVGLTDLPDGNSFDAWSSGASPKDYAVMMLEEEGFYDFIAKPKPEPLYREPDQPTYTDTIYTEGGDRYDLIRFHSANGKVIVTRYPDERNR